MSMENAELFERLGISVLLGALVGLQRERAESSLAGLRTFPLVAVLGTVSALVSREFGGWVLVATGLGLAALIVIADYVESAHAKNSERMLGRGTTTEVAMLLMFMLGAYVEFGNRVVAVAVGGGAAVLLQFKPELHGMARKLGDTDLKAIMQFVLITFIILPILPDQTYDRFGVFNPRQIWLMVVLVVGISLGGYIIYKFMGKAAGTLLGGILGGLVSSTATTVSYARRTADAPQAAMMAATAVFIAGTVVYLRVLIEISVVSQRLLPVAAPPILILWAVSVVLAILMWLRIRREPADMPEQKNPTELKSAIVFGILYALVLLGVAAAKEYLQDEALYVIAVISGLTDMDAITLSVAQMVEPSSSGEPLDPNVAWRVILSAGLSNLGFKTALAISLGHRRFWLRLLPLVLISLAVGAALLVWW